MLYSSIAIQLQNMIKSFPASKSVLWMLPAAKFLLFNSVFTGSCTNWEVGTVSTLHSAHAYKCNVSTSGQYDHSS